MLDPVGVALEDPYFFRDAPVSIWIEDFSEMRSRVVSLARKEQAALEDYTRAVQLQPDDVGNQNKLAWLYATAKDEGVRDRLKALEHAGKAAASRRRRMRACPIRSHGRTSSN